MHGDYYPLNVLADEQGISAVMDFNDLALAGDPRMDLASSIIFFFQGAGHTRPEDSKFLYDNLVQKYGKNMPRIIHLYRLYYAIHFASFCEKSDPETFEWSIRSLREHLDGKYNY